MFKNYSENIGVLGAGLLTFVIVALFFPIPTAVSAPGPDLVVSSGPEVIGVLEAGQNIEFKATVLNKGDANTGAPFTIRFRVDGKIIRDFESAQLAKGSTRTKSANWTATYGTHTVRVCADASVSDGGSIVESIESNNCAEVEFDIKPAVAPLCNSGDGKSLDIHEFKNALDKGDISFNLVTNKINKTSTFTINNNTNCTVPISLSSYKRFDHDHLSTQELFDGSGVTSIKGTGSMTVDLPSCSAQIDAWYGQYPTKLVDEGISGAYHYPNNPWVLDFDVYDKDNLCGSTPPPSAPSCTLSANPTSIKKGDSSTLSWTLKNVTSASIDKGVGSIAISNSSKNVSPESNTKYTLTASGSGGTVTCSATINVSSTPPPPSFSCPLTNKSGRTIVDFTDKEGLIASASKGEATTRNYSTSLSKGDYKVTLVSYDDHSGHGGQGQTKEQYFLNLLDGSGGVFDQTPSIGDLPEDEDYRTEVVSNSFNISKAVKSVSAQHSHWFLAGEKESIFPVCAAFDKLNTPTPDKADVSVTKSVSPSTRQVGGVFTYTLTYKNEGDLTAQSVAIADVASPVGKLNGYTITKAPNHGSCTPKSNGITCSLGSLAPGATGTIKYTAKAVSVGTIDNTVVISTPTPETTLSNNEDDARVTVVSNPPASCDSFIANPTSISSGSSSTLSWTTTGATSVSINNGIGGVSVNGSTSVSPTTNTTYTLTAVGVGGNDTCTATITISTIPAPSCTLSASPSVISSGGSTTLTWTTTNATSASINQGIGSVTPVVGGSTPVTGITSNTTYTMTAVGAGGSTTCPASVTVSTTPLADVSITKDVAPDRHLKGGVFTYTLTYKNLGNLSASNSKIEDIATPSGFLNNYTITSAPTHGTCTTNSNGISCNLGTLPVGATGTIKYTATAVEVGVIDNTATITTTTSETTTSNNTDSERVSVYTPSQPPCTVNCGGGLNPPVVVMFSKPGDSQPFASKSFIYLSQIPYTGVTGSTKGVLFVFFLSLWSALAAYFIIKRGKGGVGGQFLTSAGPVAPISERSFHRAKEPRALSVEELVTKKKEVIQESSQGDVKEMPFAGNNLPTDYGTEKDEKPRTEVHTSESGVAIDSSLEKHARERGVLVSESALSLITVPVATGHKERLDVLDSIINIALTMYPRDDGWVVLDRKRIENVIFSSRYDVVAIFSDWLSKGESEKAFAFLRLLRSHKVSVKEFLKKVAYFVDNLYRCRIGESLDNGYANIDTENQCVAWSTKDIQSIVGILVNGVDESYQSEDASVKLAIVKILELSNKSKAEGEPYYRA